MLFVVTYKDVYLNTNELDLSLPSVFANLLQEFDDVFPEEMPSGLPPQRGIEHQIDLVPGAAMSSCNLSICSFILRMLRCTLSFSCICVAGMPGCGTRSLSLVPLDIAAIKVSMQ